MRYALENCLPYTFLAAFKYNNICLPVKDSHLEISVMLFHFINNENCLLKVLTVCNMAYLMLFEAFAKTHHVFVLVAVLQMGKKHPYCALVIANAIHGKSVKLVSLTTLCFLKILQNAN